MGLLGPQVNVGNDVGNGSKTLSKVFILRGCYSLGCNQNLRWLHFLALPGTSPDPGRLLVFIRVASVSVDDFRPTHSLTPEQRRTEHEAEQQRREEERKASARRLRGRDVPPLRFPFTACGACLARSAYMDPAVGRFWIVGCLEITRPPSQSHLFRSHLRLSVSAYQ